MPRLKQIQEEDSEKIAGERWIGARERQDADEVAEVELRVCTQRRASVSSVAMRGNLTSKAPFIRASIFSRSMRMRSADELQASLERSAGPDRQAEAERGGCEDTDASRALAMSGIRSSQCALDGNADGSCTSMISGDRIAATSWSVWPRRRRL